jgi:hypothetical protein
MVLSPGFAHPRGNGNTPVRRAVHQKSLSYSTPFVIVVSANDRPCAKPEVHEVEEVEGPPFSFIHCAAGRYPRTARVTAKIGEDW